jgi:hypothetical protein
MIIWLELFYCIVWCWRWDFARSGGNMSYFFVWCWRWDIVNYFLITSGQKVGTYSPRRWLKQKILLYPACLLFVMRVSPLYLREQKLFICWCFVLAFAGLIKEKHSTSVEKHIENLWRSNWTSYKHAKITCVLQQNYNAWHKKRYKRCTLPLIIQWRDSGWKIMICQLNNYKV